MLLASYFLKKLYKSFLLFFILLVIILSFGDIFNRLQILPSIKAIPFFVIFMFPVIALLAIPLALCFSVQTVVGNLFAQNEVFLIIFLKQAKINLYKTILFFSTLVLFIYIPLLLYWAPNSYKKGKEFILNYAKEQIYQLDTNKFHDYWGSFTLYFQDKDLKNKKNPIFKNIILYFCNKNKKSELKTLHNRYLIIAQEGLLKKNYLILKNGTVKNLDFNNNYVSEFNELEIDIDRFWDKDTNIFSKQLKLIPWDKLKIIMESNNLALIEYHKRLAQILWVFFLPFISLWLMFIFARYKSNLLLTVFLSGFLFLIFYLSTSVITILFKNYYLNILGLYLMPVLFLIGTYYFYKRKAY